MTYTTYKADDGWHYQGRGRARDARGRWITAHDAAVRDQLRLAAMKARVIKSTVETPIAVRRELGAILRPPSAHAMSVPTWDSLQIGRNRANKARWAREKARKNVKLKSRALKLFG